MTDLEQHRSDLALAEKQIIEILSELQNKYDCEVEGEIDRIRTIGGYIPLVMLQMRVKAE